MSDIVRVNQSLNSQIENDFLNVETTNSQLITSGTQNHIVKDIPIVENTKAIIASGAMLAIYFPFISIPVALITGFGIYKFFSKKKTDESHKS